MNVVGRVGSLISQGVYSVATPFHPFGGAVDIIVVQQQDETFRSTPWYVRFGKFQGVLKGAEKIVRINVNGNDANFHMYLENSGEAYFIKEATPGKGGEEDELLEDSDGLKVAQQDNGLDDDLPNTSREESLTISRVETILSASAVIESRDECGSSAAGQLDLTESESERRFYEFQDEQSSHEGSVELSEYGSNRYEAIESVEHFVETQDSDTEVILFSVDGHVLTAPVSSTEENSENVKLCTPQFHLGPGKGTDICEGNKEFSTGEDAWAANYIGELNTSTRNFSSENVSSSNDALGHQLQVCEVEEERECGSEKTEECMTPDKDLHMCNNAEDACSIVKKDVFKSCLELSELAMQGGFSPTNSDSPGNINLQDLCIVNESADNNALSSEQSGCDSISVHPISNPELEDELYSASQVGNESSLHRLAAKDECCASEIVEPLAATVSEGTQTDNSMGFEISLCGKKLRAGMGLKAAAEAFDEHRICAEEFMLSAASLMKNEDLVIRYRERFLRWDKAAQIVLGVAAFGLDLPVVANDAIPVERDESQKFTDDDSEITTSSSGRRWRLWPIPFRRVKTLDQSNSNSSNEEVFVDSEPGSQNTQAEPTMISPGRRDSPRKQLLKTHIPTTEQIASLNLQEGQNKITFSFSTRVLGLQQVDAHIYLWMWNARIVISDVDGTITKSDVLGQFMPLVGRDWSQYGVAQLFSAIKENGYQLLFLSARAIVQAYLTRSFLLNLKQDGKALPNGPVVISPDGLFPSLYREVIRRAPHEFKIACLEDIKALFPADYNPFYAGFGNRDTDELSYRKIGIPKGKIFIINPKGEVAINHRIDVKSYTSLHTLVNDMFPPTSLVEQEDYNSWNFWRMPLSEIDL